MYESNPMNNHSPVNFTDRLKADLSEAIIRVSPTKNIRAMDSFEAASGPVRFKLANDCLFHMVFQDDMVALSGLLCSVLHIRPSDINSIEIRNPILWGENPDIKDFILDIKLVLNGNTIINLEMQMLDKKNWQNRSLSYLCRNFTQLDKGKDYDRVTPVIHIGFLNYTLFAGNPKFHATYQFRDIENGFIFSDNLKLKVIDLTKTDLATDADKEYNMDTWARLFKATTWEEIKKLASTNESIKHASVSMRLFSEDYDLQDRIIRYQDAINHEEYMQELLEKAQAEAENAKAEAEIAKAEAENAKAEAEAAMKQAKAEVRQSKSEVERLRAEIAALKAQVKDNS